jgi:peptide/nickel transport system permease protein
VLGYLLRRGAWTVVVLWAIVTLTFIATTLSPTDPAGSYGGLRASEDELEQIRERFGLDRPIYVQYGRYFERLASGDLGRSWASNEPVVDEITSRLWTTAELALAAMLVTLLLGIPLGLLAGLKRATPVDRAILGGSLFGVVTPPFVLGFLLLYVFAFKLGWFPLGGSGSIEHLVLPAVTLGIASAAWYARTLRSTVLNIVGEDYVRNAHAKGLAERVVVTRHILRNAIVPIVAMVALDFGHLLGGVLVIEKVFGRPGIGARAWEAAEFNDVPVVMGTVLFGAALICVCNLVADLVNARIDPRISYG